MFLQVEIDAGDADDGGTGDRGFDVLPGRSGSGVSPNSPEKVARLAGLPRWRCNTISDHRPVPDEANCMRLARSADKTLMAIADHRSVTGGCLPWCAAMRRPLNRRTINRAKSTLYQRLRDHRARALCSLTLPRHATVMEKQGSRSFDQRTLISTDPLAQPVQDGWQLPRLIGRGNPRRWALTVLRRVE